MRPTPLRGRAALGLLLLCLVAAPVAAQDADDPVERTKAAFMAAEGFDARMAVLETFLAEHPNHADVGEVVQFGADLYLEERQDRAAAVALATRQLTVSTDPEVLGSIRSVLMGLYAAPEYAGKLQVLVREMHDPAAMTFSQHLEVLEAATAAESWTLVDEQFMAALPQANAETFRADYPDREFSEEEVAAAGRNREGMLTTFAAWSLANRGKADKAVTMFRQADGKLRKGFLGVPDNGLYRYWGQTLLMLGKPEEGFEKLALAALYGGDDEAGEIARKGWADVRPREDYEDFAWSVRMKHAPVLDGFTAADYQGTVRSFHELKGKQATLVAFWFPT